MKRIAENSIILPTRVGALLLLVTLLPLMAHAASDTAAINVHLNRTRPQPGETIEVRVEAVNGTALFNERIHAVLLRPSVGTSALVLQQVSGKRGEYRTEIKLGQQDHEGIYVIHAWAGDAANPTVVGKATFLLGQVVTDFFVANYLDEKQPTEDLDNYLKAFSEVGGNFLVAHNLLTSTKVYYPSKIAATNVPRSARDVVEMVLNRADKNGYAVLLSVSWDMTRQSHYKDRMPEVKAISNELYSLYKHHPSLAGFYSYQEGSGTYYVPFVREFSAHIKSIHRKLLTACAPHMDDPLLAGYLSTVEELDILFFQTGVMASYRTDNRKKYPFRRLKDFGSLAAGAKRLQNKISINHVELFGYLENRLNPDTAATNYKNIYRQILSAATVTDADGISFFTYQAHVHVPRKKFHEVKRSHAAVAEGVKAFDLITSHISRARNPLTVYFPYSDWIIERWPNYFLPALDAFRLLGKPVDVLPYAPPLEESVYPYYPFHMNKDVLVRLLKEPTVLVLPNVSGFQQTDSDLIRAFVEQGGVVVAFGPQIPMGRSYERKDVFGADESEAMKKHTAIVVKEAVGERVNAGRRFGLRETELPEWTISNAKIIASFEDGSAAIVANRFGKGTTISVFTDAWTAARDFPELVRDIIDHALRAQGIDSMVDIVGANENIDIAISKTEAGFTVAVVNHNLNNLDVMLRPTTSHAAGGRGWTDLVSDKAIAATTWDRSVRLTIPGSGFRALEYR